MGALWVTCAARGVVATARHTDHIASSPEVLREDDRPMIRAASAASRAADDLLALAPDGELVDGNAKAAA